MKVEKDKINHSPRPLTSSAAAEQEPPSPCPGIVPSPEIAALVPNTGLSIPKQARKFLRSLSFPNLLTDEKVKDHIYANESIESWEEHCKNGKEEPVYYRFYYNLGYVRRSDKASMRTKLKRRSILSDLMGKIDFKALDEHESWYDDCIGRPTAGKRDTVSR